MLDVLGIAPDASAGDFLPQDRRPARRRSIMLGPSTLRATQFGSRSDVGRHRRVKVDGADTTIVGVLPEGFDFPEGERELLGSRSRSIRDSNRAAVPRCF